jgi:long-subunit fatty acid transport protein
MRRFVFAAAACTLIVLPLAAQNTDIESLSGLQFNFGNPGARSLGMGGAFLGLADDASAAEANPAGLTILRKPEITVEGRNYLEKQVFTTSGTFPDLQRTGFSHYGQRVDVSFASFVFPIKNFSFGVYYHEPLRNDGTGSVVPQKDPFTGKVVDVPNFFLPVDGNGNPTGGPITSAQCQTLRQKDPFACLEYTIKPFLSAVTVQEKTFGLAAAWKIGKFSIGGAARYHRFNETAFTFRVTPDLEFDSISVQATSDFTKNSNSSKDVTDVTFTGGVKLEINDKLSVGGVYKKGPRFAAPTFAATVGTGFEYVKVADTTFHVPDIYGGGVSFRPIPVLTINADAVRVKYSNLVDNFVSINATIRAIDKAYRANDVLEVHLGAEYFFPTKVPFALRVGAWRDPEHTVDFRGPLTSPEAVAAATLFPQTKAQSHVSVGGGFAWPRFQIDFAYDRSDLFKVGSLSAVMRF